MKPIPKLSTRTRNPFKRAADTIRESDALFAAFLIAALLLTSGFAGFVMDVFRVGMR